MRAWILAAGIFLGAESLLAEEIGNGFLAMNLSFDWQHDSHNGNSFDVFKVPISFSAASTNYDIVTSLNIFPEILHLDQYYSAKSRLPAGSVVPFSFASFEIQYLSAEWKIFHVNTGFKIGHYGYLTGDWITPAFSLFIAFKGSLYTFLGDHFMIQTPIEIPLGIYNNYMKEYFTLRTGIDVVFDPAGPIRNPVSTSVFYTLGFEYTYLHIQTYHMVLRDLNYLNSRFTVSILY